jgi:hypothetical protein
MLRADVHAHMPAEALCVQQYATCSNSIVGLVAKWDQTSMPAHGDVSDDFLLEAAKRSAMRSCDVAMHV